MLSSHNLNEGKRLVNSSESGENRMLVNCPRCGFQQPQDKYCARCGVDIETFRRPKPKWTEKVFGNPAFQIGIVLFFAFLVGFSLYHRQIRDLQERVSYLKNGVQVARSLSSPAEPEVTTAPPTTVPLPIVSAIAGAATTATATTIPTKPGSAWTVKVYVAEIAKPALDQLFADSASSGQFNRLGDYVAGIIPEISRRISNRDVKLLAQLEKKVENGQPIQFFQGIRQGDPDEEIGLTYFLELQEAEGGIERGNLEIQRSWREAPPGAQGPITLQRKTFPAVFELAKGSGFFMSSFLPRISLLENDEELVASAPFQILRSNSFRAGMTDSILFIEFEKP